MITFEQKGNFKKLDSFLEQLKHGCKRSLLDEYGERGVEALKAATPVDTGETRDSWYYEVYFKKNSASLVFKNANVKDGANVAILLQYGHATRNHGYVTGIDYINPALKPVFDDLANQAWKELTK